VQLVDARNPLFYYSQDLHDYAATTSTPPRPCLILVNKADFLTPQQRQTWAKHFTARGWNYAFFSAREEQQKLSMAAREERDREDFELEDVESEEVLEERVDDEPEQQPAQEDSVRVENGGLACDEPDVFSKVLTRKELLDRLAGLAESRYDNVEDQKEGVTVGMVGFPNVGKSSVINVLLGVTPMSHTKTRVAVSSTPGKTKHFQTLLLEDGTTTLCDCPGLVFPSFVSTTAEMVCAGVLPIAQLRDHLSPIDLICRRLPRTVLESFYGIVVTTEASESHSGPTAADFLRSLCEARGYMTAGSGVPDVNRAARMVLWDYVEGRLFFCHPPLDLDEQEEANYVAHTVASLLSLGKVQKRLEVSRAEEPRVDECEGEVILGKTSSTRVRPAKKWGKKGRKLRDKDPYADNGADLVDEGEEEEELSGLRGPYLAKATGRKQPAGFARAVFPHHPTYTGTVL